jgi:peptidoglycan-N-acetylglucosamine deacetylase
MSDLFLRTPFWQRWYDPQALYQTGDARLLLTFDDGPHPRWTLQLVEILDRFEVQALFFLRGDHLQQYPEIARHTAAAGHQLCLHGMYHKSMALKSKSRIREELLAELNLFAKFQLPTPRYVRPPYGYFLFPYQRAVRSLNLTNVLWNLAIKDFSCDSSALIQQRLLKLQHPGDVVLLHDHARCTEQLLSILPEYLRISQQRGLRFVSRGEKL